MKRLFSYLGALLFLGAASVASATTPVMTVTISSPLDGQTFVVDSLPVSIFVEGTISISQSNINDQKVCVTVDSGTPVCEPAYVSGLGNVSSRNYSILVTIPTAGSHTIQVSTANSTGGHSGVSSVITINVQLSMVTCSEKDPPAIANEYMNSLNLPQSYNQVRGQVIRIIAFNSSNGAYGTCQYDEALIKLDVDNLLAQVSPQ